MPIEAGNVVLHLGSDHRSLHQVALVQGKFLGLDGNNPALGIGIAATMLGSCNASLLIAVMTPSTGDTRSTEMPPLVSVIIFFWPCRIQRFHPLPRCDRGCPKGCEQNCPGQGARPGALLLALRYVRDGSNSPAGSGNHTRAPLRGGCGPTRACGQVRLRPVKCTLQPNCICAQLSYFHRLTVKRAVTKVASAVAFCR
jgi:hypothetical protein